MINQKYDKYISSIESGDICRAMMMVEKPYKVLALQNMVDRGIVSKSNPSYWDEVFHAYSLVENVYDDLDIWLPLMDGATENRNSSMSPSELEVFESLPDVITVYRGARDGVNEDGISYSIDREQAVMFANRFPNGFNGKEPTEPVLIEAKVKKEDVLAYISRESELVVEPDKLMSVNKIYLSRQVEDTLKSDFLEKVLDCSKVEPLKNEHKPKSTSSPTKLKI